MNLKFGLFLSAIVIFTTCTENKSIKIACIGDSITEGAGIKSQSKNSYPVQLDSILGSGYSVLNCGRSGANALKEADLSYWDCNEFYNAFAFEPDAIVIKLGTNDSKPQNWNEENYAKDLQSLIDTLNTLPSKPQIYLCYPAPAFNQAWGIRDSVIVAGVIPAIQKAAQKNNLKVIDFYKAFRNHVEFFPDSIHPNEAGAKAMAEIVAKELKQN